MMIIKTKYHGETQIQEDQTIVFKNGLPGFTGEKKFVILPLSEDSPFVVLQSVQSEEPGIHCRQSVRLFQRLWL